MIGRSEIEFAGLGFSWVRTLWGRDWPHPICPVAMPNDGDLTDHLADRIPDTAVRQHILVENPARLYGFRREAEANR